MVYFYVLTTLYVVFTIFFVNIKTRDYEEDSLL